MFESWNENATVVGYRKQDEGCDQNSSKDYEWNGCVRFHRDLGEEVGDTPEESQEYE